MKDLRVTLEDRPGELARLGETLGAAGINIEGMCAVTADGHGVVHLLVEDTMATRKALEGAGIKVEAEADPIVSEFLADGADRPGTLGAMARAVSDVGVNVRVVYVATGNRSVLVTSDNAKAMAALGL